MKKLLIIFALLVTVTLTRAQTATYAIPKSATIGIVSAASTLTNAVVKWFQFNAEKDNVTTQDYQCLLTKLTGSHDVSVQLYGRKFTGDSWVAIGAAVTSGTITTTAKVTVSNPVPNRYRQFKVEFTGTGTATTSITNQYLKFWLQ